MHLFRALLALFAACRVPTFPPVCVRGLVRSFRALLALFAACRVPTFPPVCVTQGCQVGAFVQGTPRVVCCVLCGQMSSFVSVSGPAPSPASSILLALLRMQPPSAGPTSPGLCATRHLTATGKVRGVKCEHAHM
jgi:hypothetical protein